MPHSSGIQSQWSMVNDMYRSYDWPIRKLLLMFNTPKLAIEFRGAWYCCNDINPILHGAGHFVPRLVDYLAWRLSGRSDWAHISWLFFFQHSLCPIEAIFQKKNLKIWKIEKMFFNRSNIKGSPLWKKKFENYFLPIFVANHIFST